MTTTESGPEASARLGEVLLEARGVSKFFPGVRALEDVDFTLRTGEVHALVGENGAGKSTLMKVLSGLYQPDEGEVLMRGEPITLPTPLAAQQAGISVIHQEFFLMNHLTAAQNMFIGREPRLPGGFLDHKKLNNDAAELLERLGVKIDPRIQVGKLTVASQQLLEIAKALSFNSKVLIMDEPTAALNDAEVETLFRESTETVLDVKKLSTAELLKDVSFHLEKGEILGFAGLMGAGRTEVARALIGADPRTGGVVTVGGKQVDIHSPKDAVKIGIGYLSEDRKRYGLVLQQDVAANTVLPSLKKFSTGGLLQDGRMRQAAGKWVKTLATKTPSVRQQARNLSGGNQQKVVLAKWLERDCDILIFDEPTRGIDVGAKQEIYDLLDELTDQGKSIIMISSEMEEVLRMSDRIAVMCNGRITGFLPNAEATQEKIMELATQFTTTETTSEAN